MTELHQINFIGGLDQESGNLEVNPGTVREAENYEALPEGGYKRIDGYIKWSGGSLFPDLTDATLQVIQINILPDTLRQRAFNLIYRTNAGVRFYPVGFLPIFEDGFEVGNYLLIQNINASERIQSGDKIPVLAESVVVDVIDGDVELSNAEYGRLIEAVFDQTNIAQKPAGDGPIKLIHTLDNGNVYVFRLDSTVGARGGFTISLASANATAFGSGFSTIGSVEWEAFPTGDEFTHRWQAINHDFVTRTDEIWVAFGHNRIYRFDGGIATSSFEGIPQIQPTAIPTATSLVIEHADHLFAAYGTSLMYSGLEQPTDWTAATGAGEVRIGSPITGFQVVPGEALAIFTEESIHILYGTSAADFRLETFSDEIGAAPHTVQNMPTAIFCDRRGVLTLTQSDRYGDYVHNTLSHHFDRLYRQVKANNLFTSVSRSKSQYRVLDEYGRGFWMTFKDRGLAGAMPIDLKLENRMTAVGRRRNNIQQDELFFGDEEGWVYRMDYGVSFDGRNIPSFIKFPFCYCGSPRHRKRFRLAVLDCEGDPRTSIQSRAEIEHGHDYHADNRIVNAQVETGRQLFRGGQSWDLPPVMEIEIYTEGSGTCLGTSIRSDSNTTYSHTLHSMIIHYNVRGMKR